MINGHRMASMARCTSFQRITPYMAMAVQPKGLQSQSAMLALEDLVYMLMCMWLNSVLSQFI